MKILAVTGAALLLSLTLIAAEEGETSEQEAETAAQADITEAPDTVEPPPDIGLIEEENSGAQDDEDFVPSVRIIEDLPVAFPVDI